MEDERYSHGRFLKTFWLENYGKKAAAIWFYGQATKNNAWRQNSSYKWLQRLCLEVAKEKMQPLEKQIGEKLIMFILVMRA